MSQFVHMHEETPFCLKFKTRGPDYNCRYQIQFCSTMNNMENVFT